MTLSEVISKADMLRPNTFDVDMKTQWISELDGSLQVEVFGMNHDEVSTYDYANDHDTQLFVDPPYDKMYPTYLVAMISFYQSEYSEYQNVMAMFNIQYSDFARWVQRKFNLDIGTDEGFYITAYGIAVKHGFSGSEEEWLDSLHGADGSDAHVTLVEYGVSNSTSTIPEIFAEELPSSLPGGAFLWMRLKWNDGEYSYSIARQGIDGQEGSWDGNTFIA